MKDWRDDYIICEHIAKDKELPARHQQFRVFCEECYKRGFLWSEITLNPGIDNIAGIKEQ